MPKLSAVRPAARAPHALHDHAWWRFVYGFAGRNALVAGSAQAFMATLPVLAPVRAVRSKEVQHGGIGDTRQGDRSQRQHGEAGAHVYKTWFGKSAEHQFFSRKGIA
jgi:hypothetical protein